MIIGLHGVAESGKDTSADYIEEYFRDTAVRIDRRSFAFPLKQSAVAALGIEDANPIAFCEGLKSEGATITTAWYDEEAMNQRSVRITGREYLQNYGTEAHRDIFGQDFWVDACLPMSLQYDYGKVIVVTDVRFPNEAERIHKLSGKVWEIDRPDKKKGDGHASEQRLPDELIDVTIRNHWGLDELRSSIRRALIEELGRRVGSTALAQVENEYKITADALPG